MVDLASIRALTFDCYGTLIDWERGILRVLLPWADGCGLGGAGISEQLLSEFGAAEPLREAQGPDGAPGFMSYPHVLRAVMGDIAVAFGVDPSSPATRAAAEALGASVGDWPAFSDTPLALAALKRRLKLVIVSNVDRASFARTNEKLGVGFDAIITAEDVRSYKPNPAHFHRALESLGAVGVAPREVLHVAQSLFHDHVPAKSLGLATCWVRRGRGREPAGAAGVTDEAARVRPDFEVETLAELAALAGCAGA